MRTQMLHLLCVCSFLLWRLANVPAGKDTARMYVASCNICVNLAGMCGGKADYYIICPFM